MELALFEHFSKVLGTATSGRTSINFNELGIQPIPLDQIEADINSEEVWAAIKDMLADRAQ
jgi:hypothetical protein